MSMSVNKVILLGRLGQNPEVKYTPSGSAVANFSVATNEAWNDKSGQKQERTEWHRVVVWGKTAELCAQYLTKGRQVYLEGRLQTRQWQDKDGQTKYTTEVQATTVQFIGAAAGAGRDSGQYAEGGDSNFNSAPQGFGGGAPGLNASSVGGFGQNQQNQASQPTRGINNNEPTFTEDDIPF